MYMNACILYNSPSRYDYNNIYLNNYTVFINNFKVLVYYFIN